MRTLFFKRLKYKIRHDYLTMNNIVIFVAIFIGLSWAWGSIKSMQQNYELQRSVNNKRQQVQIETLKVALLEYETNYHNSDEYQELAVRQRTGKGLPGEKQLIVPTTDANIPEKTETMAANTQKPTSNFQQWMNFLFGGSSHKK